jgi:hypothetical protein
MHGVQLLCMVLHLCCSHLLRIVQLRLLLSSLTLCMLQCQRPCSLHGCVGSVCIWLVMLPTLRTKLLVRTMIMGIAPKLGALSVLCRVWIPCNEAELER